MRFDRKRDLKRRALSRGRGDLERPAQSLQALLDAEESEAPRPFLVHHPFDGKPSPIVLEEGVDYLSIPPQLKLDVGSRGMFGDVGKALLHDAVEGRLNGRRQPSFDCAVYANAQPRARGHPFHKELKGGEEPQIIQDGGPEFVGEAAQLGLNGVEMVPDLMEALPKPWW